jgi:hypothetical protein
MPWYELWENGEHTLESVSAKDPADAVAIFGEQLGLRLTLEDQGDVAPYMLREIEANAGWSERRPKIAVWIIRE